MLAQPAPLPECMIIADPESIVDDALGDWGTDASTFPTDVRDAYVQALRSLATVHTVCQEYRVALTEDRTDDLADQRSGKRIDCPTHVLWSEGGSVDTWYSGEGGPLAIWQTLVKIRHRRCHPARPLSPSRTPATVAEPTRWGERVRHRPAPVGVLQAAVVRRRRVRLTYTSGARRQSERVIDPWGLVDKDDVWYLVAGTERGRRTFRVDRIEQAAVTDERFERLDDFILQAAWDEVVAIVGRDTLADVGDRADRGAVLADPPRPLRAPLPCRQRRRRRQNARPGRRPHTARHRPNPRRLGQTDRGRRPAIGTGRTRPHRHRAGDPLPQHASRTSSAPINAADAPNVISDLLAGLPIAH
jgi:WYL domain